MTSLRISFPTVAAAIMATGLAFQASAQDQQMGTVVVTAAGHEQQVKEAPATITVITREELEKASYNNLFDALKGIPSITLSSSDNNSKTVSIRGMGSGYTVFLIDGMRMRTSETQTNGATGTDQSWLPPIDAIERIEVVRGPVSSLYGPDGMGGVINIITRKVGKTWTGSVRTQATLQERSESGNIYQSNFYLTGPVVQDLIGLSVNGSFFEREEDKIKAGFINKHDRSLGLKLSFTPSKDHDIVLGLDSAEQDHRSRLGWSQNGAATSLRTSKRENYALKHTGRWGWSTSDTYLVREEVSTQSGTRAPVASNLEFNSAWVVPVGANHMLNTGVYYNEQSVKEPNKKVMERDQWAIFLEDDWQVLDDFKITAGARYDSDSRSGNKLSPRVYGVWNVSEKVTLKSGVSTGFKAPQIRQVSDYVLGSSGGNTYGNPNLKAEESLSTEIGILFDDLQGNQYGVTLFNNEFKNKIHRSDCVAGVHTWAGNCNTNPDPTKNTEKTYLNVDSAITRGVEMTYEGKVSSDLKVSANYSFVKTEQRSGPNAGKPLDAMPKHQAALAVDWEVDSKLNTWAKFVYQGEESQGSGNASARRFAQPGYGMLDIGANYKLNKNVTFMAGVYNILDKEVIYTANKFASTEDGRRYWLGMSAKF